MSEEQDVLPNVTHKCVLCRWFDRGDKTCRKRSPNFEGFPKVNELEWCGDFESNGDNPISLSHICDIGLSDSSIDKIFKNTKALFVFELLRMGRCAVSNTKGIGPKTIEDLDKALKETRW
ncbi:MAG: hypothetical protein E6R03_15780 [Hyphomicrobiaceae bacterium]|nr:MAG: hypothetical protein E6R03_15780 [Hyphomicrobiaceae bacterium]